MNAVAVICNIILSGFTCFVVMTDGTPKEGAYIVFTMLSVLIPIVTIFVILRSSEGDGRMSAIIKITAIICNIVLLGFACWAFIDQYPHPNEEGFIPYLLFIFLTPILNVVMLWISMKSTKNLAISNIR